MSKSFYIQTYGCQMNYHDSERMSGMFDRMGFSVAESLDSADVALINTCAVREKPERKLFAELAKLRKAKERNPDMILCVAGCMAPRDGDVIRSKAPWVDILLGPRSIARLPDMVRKVELQRRPIESLDLLDDPTPLTPVRRSGAVTAWVDILFGCSYNCSFCAVPSARGRERSRLPGEIFDEIDDLKYVGYQEVTLLGQTVNAYGRDWKYMPPDSSGFDSTKRMDFSWLLEQINQRAPDIRVRFTSPHPQLFTKRLVNAIAELPNVCEHVHFPLQSADDEVLERMNRSYRYGKFREIVDNLRAVLPNICITTDIIVGFPGETEEQFQKTLQAFDDIQFDQAFMFAYSPRRHTTAFDMKDVIPPEVQQRRLAELIDHANGLFRDKNQTQVGQTFEVLVEGVSEKNAARMTGRTRGNKTVVFEGTTELTGKLVDVKTTKGFLWGFTGEMVSP
ncbi:tRNA (N6-isopentenyl adenosine(37)-C2)-methylthiotransferase MiaB [Calditrichota bacterium]